jgi:hypothetical protein
MDDIDEIIRRLDHWIKVWGYLDADGRSKGIKYLQDAVTALQQMQKNYNRVFQRALDAEQKNKEFNEQFSKHQSTWWDNEAQLKKRIS